MTSSRNYFELSEQIKQHVRQNHDTYRTPCSGIEHILNGYVLDTKMEQWARHYAAELYEECKSMHTESNAHLRRHEYKIRQLSKAAVASLAGAAGVIGGQLYMGMPFGAVAGIGAAFISSYVEHHSGIAADFTREMERGAFFKVYEGRMEPLARKFITRCVEHVDDIAQAQTALDARLR